jgi:hypothetical protein
MATFTWEVYANTPAWFDISSNTMVFSGSATDLAEPITVGSYQDGSHLGDGSPGSDQCGTNHVPNVKYISTTQCDIGAGTVANTSLDATEVTLRVEFTDASSVAISNARFYTYDSTTVTTEAVGVEAYAFAQSNATKDWVLVNDDSGNTGGDNTGERLDLDDQTADTEHYFYIAISARPESVGAKGDFELGIALTYS